MQNLYFITVPDESPGCLGRVYRLLDGNMENQMLMSDIFIKRYEEEFGEYESESCEYFSACECCHETGWKDMFNYDHETGNYYCDYCLKKMNISI